MPAERYFYSNHLVVEEPVFLEGQEFHHLVHVMRSRIHDEVEIVNGHGQLAQAVVSALEKRRAILTPLEVSTAPEPQQQLILAQALPRLNRLEWILEKGTELGMTEIWLFPGAHSEKKEPSPHQTARLESLLISAMKQCGRLFLPKILYKPPITSWKGLPWPAYFGDLDPQAPPLAQAWHRHPTTHGVIFCIGPESGFSPQEIGHLRQLGVQGVKLHRNILRTETAAIAALSLLSHWLDYICTPL